MYAQTALKSHPLLRNGAYGIVMRGVQKMNTGVHRYVRTKYAPLCCIKLDTATDIKAPRLMQFNFSSADFAA